MAREFSFVGGSWFRDWLAGVGVAAYWLAMEIKVSDELVRGIEMTEEQWLLNLAIGLFVDHRVTLGRGAAIAGISKPAFLDALGQRRIPIHYDAADLEGDLKTIANLRESDLRKA